MIIELNIAQYRNLLKRWNAEVEERRFLSLAERCTDFIGIASLDGSPHYVNPAGLGHFRTGRALPFLVDLFRIDHPRTRQPMNIATVSRDLTAQKRSESQSRHLNETLEHSVAERTAELAEANDRLRAQMIERERTDVRLQKLQLELFHAARLSTAGQMAAALAHEINQPLTAVTNSIHAVQRLLAKDALARWTRCTRFWTSLQSKRYEARTSFGDCATSSHAAKPRSRSRTCEF